MFLLRGIFQIFIIYINKKYIIMVYDLYVIELFAYHKLDYIIKIIETND